MARRLTAATLLAALALGAVPSPAAAADPAKGVRTPAQVCDDIRRSGPEAIEGVWRLTAPDRDGALVAIERSADGSGSYVITIVEAPDRALIPGTLIGEATRGSERGAYDAWMYADAPLPGSPAKSRKKFTLSLASDGNRLTFKPHRSPLAFNLYMSVPYLFIRPSVRNERSGPVTPQGAERVFPAPAPPLEPVYL